MLYAMHEAKYYASQPLRAGAKVAREFWGSPLNPMSQTLMGRNLFAGAELIESTTRRYGKPEWNIDSIKVGQTDVRVRPTVVWESPWCRLIQFDRDMADMRRASKFSLDPAVLIVAPLSGHYATLLRGTVEAFLPDHAVFITDWKNVRDVPMMEGRFDFYDYVDHIRTMLGVLGSRPNVVAVCQPGPPVLAAAAMMAEDGDPSRPASMTLIGSPIDTRKSPTAANALAEEKPFAWFSSNMIYTVPLPYPGAARRVYPGFVQLASFMSMNQTKHQDAHQKYFNDLVAGDGDSADKHREFYDEYLSVLDLTEEFYLQTIEIVFQKHLLAKGELMHRGRKVRPEFIFDIALMTVEGEDDDISGVGQTQAAHGLCKALPDSLKELYVAPKVGHYGVFNGRRFREDIYPRVREFILRTDPNFAPRTA